VALVLTIASLCAVALLSESPEAQVPEIRLEVPESDFIESLDDAEARGHKTLAAIVNLRAYCEVAADKAADFLNSHSTSSDTAMVNFVKILGEKSSKENVVTAYSEAMGEAKGLFDGGIGMYLLSHLSHAITTGVDVTVSYKSGGRTKTRLSHKILGLTTMPRYFDKLAVSQMKFLSAREATAAANQGADAQAAAAWLQSGQKNQYKSFKARADNAIADQKASYEKNLENSALKTIKANFAKSGDLSPLPSGGISGANAVAPLDLPNDEQVAASAKKAASDWLEKNKDVDASKEASKAIESTATANVTHTKEAVTAKKEEKAVARPPAAEEVTCSKSGTPSEQFCSGESCFVIVADRTSQGDAQCQCTKLGGALACITNAADQAAVTAAMKSQLNVGTWDAKMWIGGEDPKKSASWTCGKKAMSYTNWRSGEGRGDNEMCINLAKFGGYKWEDFTCSRSLPFVCSVPKA